MIHRGLQLFVGLGLVQRRVCEPSPHNAHNEIAQTMLPTVTALLWCHHIKRQSHAEPKGISL